MKDIKLAAVVTLYNPSDDDINNINSYIDDVDLLYVIDNTEGYDNKKRLPSSKKIKYFFNNSNDGVSYALNKGAKMALDAGYKYLLTLDQDTSFESGTLDVLKGDLNELDMSKVAILTPYHETRIIENKPSVRFDSPTDVMTSANIINLDIWKKVNGYKEWLFIDGIDIEYCLNIASKGYKIIRDNSVKVKHNLGDLFYKNLFNRPYICMNHSAIRRYYIMRNYHYIYDLYKEYNKEYCNNLINQRHNIIAVILFEKDKINKLKMYIKGYRDYKNGVKGRIDSDVSKKN